MNFFFWGVKIDTLKCMCNHCWDLLSYVLFFSFVGPSGPGDVTLVEAQTTQVEITWVAAMGEFDFYIVTITPEGGLETVGN